MEAEDYLLSQPVDDAGSETLARYEFQVVLAAHACVEMLLDDTITEIVCELHEDYIVRRRDCLELVSVKHIEPSVGAWTLAEIVKTGGIEHLFTRWVDSDETAQCTLKTNGGLKRGAKEAHALKAIRSQPGLDNLAAALKPKLKASTTEQVTRFVLALRIDDELPKRDDLWARLVHHELSECCDLLGWPQAEIAEKFKVICELVRSASMADLRSTRRSLYLGSSMPAEIRALARKTITRQKIAEGFNRTSASRKPSALVQKLSRGGFGPTDVEGCKALRADFLAYENRWSSELPGDDNFQARQSVLEAAIEAEKRTRLPGQPYGQAMRSELARLLDEAQIRLGSRTLDGRTALGLAYDETDRCRIWWSDSFQLDK